ncbi:MAG: hypothetical protein Q9181_001440 [Wetmoreana brouardii]
MTVLGYKCDPTGFQPLPSLASLPYMKNLQLDIRFHVYPRYDHSYRPWLLPLGQCMYCPAMEKASFHITDALLSMAATLAPISDLQSLKIKFPCLCSTDSEASSQRYRRLLSATLEPLRQLRFSAEVTFIAAEEMDWCESYMWEYYKSDAGKSWESKTRDHQCPESACVDFAASFQEFETILTDSALPRPQLSFYGHRWLGLKWRAAPHIDWIGTRWHRSTLTTELCSLWKFVNGKFYGNDNGRDEVSERWFEYSCKKVDAFVERLEWWAKIRDKFDKNVKRVGGNMTIWDY